MGAPAATSYSTAIEPLGLVLKAGTWYLVASVPSDRRGARTYRISRILAAVVLDDVFERPAAFDLESHWTGYQRDYEQRLFRGTATIRLSPAGRQLLFLVGTPAARAGHAAMSDPDEDGWTSTTVPIESISHAHHALLQLGADVEVLAPAELRELTAASAQAMVSRYAGGSSSRLFRSTPPRSR